MSKGDFQIESNYEETFTRNSCNNNFYSPVHGGGGGIARAESISPSSNSDNVIEVTDSDYTINGEKTSYGGELENVYAGDEGSNNSVTVKGGNILYILSGGRYNNIINIYGGKIGTYSNGTWGGLTYSGNDATGNVINMYDGWSRFLVGGWHSFASGNSGNASNNTVNVYGGTVDLYLYGGNAQLGDANQNTVNISGGTITGGVYGGFSTNGDGTANDNTVIISDGTINENTDNPRVIGGISIDGENDEANNNSVQIKGGVISTDVIGGFSESGEANNNSVIIDGGTLNKGVFGGWSSGNSANGNIITLNSGTITGQVYGGWLNYGVTGTASNNTVNINGGTVGMDVHGGEVSNGTSNNNTVNISNGKVSGMLFGGYVNTSGTAANNTINISGGTVGGNIFGAWTYNGDATGNTINISGMPDISSSVIFGANSVGGQSVNNFYIYNGAVSVDVVTGNTLNIYTKDLTAKNIYNFEIINFYLPESTVNGDTILTLSESSTDISGAVVKAGVQGNANLNNGDTITLLTNAGTITDTGTTYGKLSEGVSLTYDLTVKKDGDNKIIATIGSTGDSDSGSSDSGDSDSGGSDSGTPTVTDDSNNVKNFYNTDSGDIYGGYTDSGNAQNNTVNLYSGNFENIYGGYAPSGSTSNNVLNVRNKNISAQNLYNFSTMNFYIPNDAANGDTMLTLTDSAATDLSGVSIRAGVVAGNGNLAVGDTINLLQNSNGFKTDSATNYGRLTEGVSLDYGLTVSNGGSNILATINSVPQTLNTQTQQLPLGGGLTALKTVDAILDNNTLPDIGLDFDFESDTEDASAAEISDVVITEPKGWEIFASAGGGALKTKAGGGSYVDMKFSSFDVGLARTLENGGAGKLVFAPIIDYAHGNYDSYLADGTHGSGSTKYIAGGGVFRNMWNNGFYVEGSYRIGRVRNDFASNDMDKAFGQRVSYDTKATAMAGHLKLGRNLRLNKNNLLDVYATYYHAHQGGMNATLAPYGDQYRISSANSGRFRIGYRMTTRTSKISRIYTGLAYQYEHASGITANYLSKNLSTASAGDKGSSGMIELGWQIKPLKNNPWMVDINATGWIGHQRGVTAMAKIQKSF